MSGPTGRRPRVRRLLAAVGAAVLGGTLVAGCSLGGDGGIYDVPLPGGPEIGSDGYQVVAEFTDALDLVPQAAVKVDNVSVGKVTDISLRSDGRAAVVSMQLNGAVDLPANATARITQTSLLGEKFVSLDRPDTGASGSLRAARTIGLQGTSESADAERVLGAMSLLLNGGGIDQFQDISRELSAVSKGREPEIKAFLTNVSALVASLNERKGAITDALDSLDRLGVTLKDNQTQLATAIEQLPPGLQVLVDQREQLVSMLTALDRLSTVTVDTLDQSQDAMVSDLKRLDPILAQLAASGQALPDALQILFTFPFPDSVLGAIKGDYVNAFLVTNFSTAGGTISNDNTASGWPAAYPDSVRPGDARSGTGAARLLDPSASSSPSTSSPTTSGASPATPTQIGPPPMMLPPTSSAGPGIPTSTVTTTPPATGTPTGTATSTPTVGTPTTGTPAPTTGTPTTTRTATPSGTRTTRRGGG